MDITGADTCGIIRATLIIEIAQTGITNKDGIAIVAATISVLSALASGYISLKGQRLQYFNELRRWADSVCNVLSEADHACGLDPKAMAPNAFFELRHSLSHSLSAHIDRGRWFFPNLVFSNRKGTTLTAFQGRRQPALDYLVDAYSLVRRLNYKDKAPNLKLRDELVEARKAFISEVQIYLDPRIQPAQFRRLTSYRGPIR